MRESFQYIPHKFLLYCFFFQVFFACVKGVIQAKGMLFPCMGMWNNMKLIIIWRKKMFLGVSCKLVC